MAPRPRISVSAVMALLSAITVLGITVWMMTAPWFTTLAAPGQVDSARAGLTRERMVEVAEEVRFFVTDVDAPALPAVIDGRAAFDTEAVSHLVDVRNVVLASRWATLVAAGLFLLVALYVVSTDHHADLGTGMQWGGMLLLTLVGLGLFIGLMDFDRFFSAFHGVFFQPGTWTFPADSLLILVFPLSFWILAGTVTGGIAAVLSAVLVLAGRLSLARA